MFLFTFPFSLIFLPFILIQLIPSINKAIDKMVDDIRNDNVANKQVELCLISFDDKAHLEQNWKPVSQVEPASFTAGGSTNLEAGLTMALRYSHERSNYYSEMGAEVRMPFLITITDGYANSGDFNVICNEIRQREKAGKIRPFTIAVGNYDKETVARLSDKKRVLEFVDPYARLLSLLVITMHVVAATNDIDQSTLNKLRGMCVNEVKSTYGKISFENAVKTQKG